MTKRTAILGMTALFLVLAAVPGLGAQRAVLAEMFGATW